MSKHHFPLKKNELLTPYENFINQPLEKVLPPYLSAQTREHIEKVLDTGKISEYEYQLMIGGNLNHYEARMVKIDENHVLTLVRNITEKKNNEKAINQQNSFISTLLDSIPNPLFYMDINSVYLGINNAFAEFFGVEKGNIVGKTMFEWDDLDVAFKNHADDLLIFQGKEKIQTRERTLTLKNGKERNVLVNKSAFHTPEGKVAGLIGLIIDITERKQNEHELLIAKEKAEESDRLKTSFLHNLNHEIRTPLNAILGFSDLLFEDVPEEQKREYVGIINSNAEQLLRIIDDVLIVSRLDAERMGSDKIQFSLNQLLNDLKLTFSNACKDKNLELSFESADDIEIFTDRAKVRQVLSGLLENAVKYTIKGSISMNYVINGQELRISVTDTGIGISPAELKHIFERFFRGEKPQRLAIRGNGLGLSIALGLAKLLNGNIEVQSELGMGSTFTLVLPDVVVKKNHTDLPEEFMTRKPEKQTHCTILIAEDEDDNYEYLRAISCSFASVVDRAVNGLEAIECVEKKTYNLVLMDIKMPVMDGFEATKAIRSKFPTLPIVVQTAFSQPQEVRQAIEAGATDVLIKPINKDVFLKVIQRLLGL